MLYTNSTQERNIDGDWKILFQTSKLHLMLRIDSGCNSYFTVAESVKKDEELLLHYGPSYWIDDPASEDEEDPDL